MISSKKYFQVLKAIIIFVVASHSHYSFSQEKWSLEKCIDYALKNSLYIKQQELNAAYSKNNVWQSRAGILPNLNGSASQNYSRGRSVDRFTNSFSEDNTSSNSFSLSSSITLFSGFQNFNTIRKSEFDLKASLMNLEKAKNDIALNISSAYLQVLYNTDLVEIAMNQLEITTQQVERTRKLVDAGSMAKGNLLQVEAQAASEELQVVNAQNQLSFSYLTLMQLLDLESTENFIIEKPEFADIAAESTLLTAGQVYLEAEKNLPQIKSAEFSLKSAEKGLAISKGGVSPRLTLTGSYGSGYSDARQNVVGDPVIRNEVSGFTTDANNNILQVYSFVPSYNYETTPFKDQIKNNVSKTLSFNLTIPIFNGLQTKTAISNAKINVLNAELNLSQAKKQLLKEIQQAHADATASLKKFNSTKKAVASMEEAFKYTQQKFDVGLVNTVDYNTAKNNLTKAKADLLQAKYEFIFKSKILDFYRGNNIKL